MSRLFQLRDATLIALVSVAALLNGCSQADPVRASAIGDLQPEDPAQEDHDRAAADTATSTPDQPDRPDQPDQPDRPDLTPTAEAAAQPDSPADPPAMAEPLLVETAPGSPGDERDQQSSANLRAALTSRSDLSISARAVVILVEDGTVHLRGTVVDAHEQELVLGIIRQRVAGLPIEDHLLLTR